MKYYLIPIFFLCFVYSSFAEDNLTIKYNAYIDTYIATDNDRQPHPDTNANKYRTFASVGSLRDEFAINIAQIGAKITYSDDVRANFVIQTGNLPEFGYYKYDANIQQANVGYRIWDKLWLDAGIFLTHIGGESYLPKDNWLSSHSLVTLFEPFYQQGVKLVWESEQFTAGLHVLNGNGILEDNNNNKSIGTYLLFAPSKVFNVSYAGVFGNENDEAPVDAKFHIYHNLCINLNPTEKINLKAQFDYSTLSDAIPNEDILDSSKITFSDGSFMGFSAQARYLITDKFSGTVRFSYFDNSDYIYEVFGTGMDGMALTAGMEYKPTDNSYIRLEGRMITINEGESKAGFPGRIFYDGEEMTNSRMEVLLNFGVWFE